MSIATLVEHPDQWKNENVAVSYSHTSFTSEHFNTVEMLFM
jgi:hypothetical protein